jgi:hypothetical protein
LCFVNNLIDFTFFVSRATLVGQAPYVFLERLNGILDIHHTRDILDILDILVDILGILVGSRDILGMDLAGNKAEGTRKMGAD